MSSSSPTPADCVSLVSSTTTTEASSYVNKPIVLEQRRYVHSGIGGAGNYHKVDVARSQAVSFIRISLSRCKKTFSTGIGGAGNRHPATEIAVPPADDHAGRPRPHHERSSDSYHYGIGGSGNQVKRDRHQIDISSGSSLIVTNPSKVESLSYGEQPVPLGAADRLAAKLFGIRKQPRPTTSARRNIGGDLNMPEHRHPAERPGLVAA